MIQKPPTLVNFDVQEIQTCNANGSLICDIVVVVVVVVVVVGGIGRCRRVRRPLGSSQETANLTIPRPSLNPSTLLQIYHSLLSPTPLCNQQHSAPVLLQETTILMRNPTYDRSLRITVHVLPTHSSVPA
jgi:hypothetical protein